jgi:alpha-methylacyl-CoA racemase
MTKSRRERVPVQAGVKVVEIGGMGPGPFAGMVLADHGDEIRAEIRAQMKGRTHA